MSFYSDQVLPRAINVVMDNGPLRDVRQAVLAPLRGTVVELGFGTGLNLPHYPSAVDRILAIEPAVLGRSLARGRLEACPIPVEFAGLDGQRLPLEDGVADAVLCTWTLCTIPDPQAALREARRVLRPEGTLHFAEHGAAPDPSVRAWQDRLNPIQRVVAGGCNLNRAIDQEVRDGGFELVELETGYMRRTPRVLGFTYQGVARALLCVLALWLGVVASPRGAVAAPAQEGRWQLDDAVGNQGAADGEANRVLALMSAPMRWLARGPVRAAARASETLHIHFEGGEVTITTEDGEVWTSDLQGTPAKATMPDGAPVSFRRWMDGETLRAEGSSTLGGSTYRFVVDPSADRLSVETRMTSRLLPDSLRWTLTYRRVEGER